MMIKKQLGVLAGSIVVAASSNAAIDLSGGNALAIFNTAGQGSYYQFIAGSTGDSLAGGNGFAIDVSAASAALGGTIESFAVLALKSATCSGLACYNYTEFLYADVGGGLVFAGTPSAPTTNLASQVQINNIQSFLNGADLGANGEGTIGDFDSIAAVAGFLNFGPTGLVLNEQTLGALTNPQAISILAPAGAIEGVYLDGTTFAATAESTVIPVPAAAWLFGSALVGLGVVRRKK